MNNARLEYMQIIRNAKNEMANGIRPKDRSDYRKNFRNKKLFFQFHHILPRSLFPLWIERQSNIVALTKEEHIQCHLFLTKIYPTYNMYMAAHFFKSLDEEGEQEFYRKYSEHMSQKNKENWQNQEYREKVISARKEHFKNWTEEEKQAYSKKHSDARKKYLASLSEEEREKVFQKLNDGHARALAENGEKIREKMHLAKSKLTDEDWKNIISKRKQTMSSWTEEQWAEYHDKMSERAKKVGRDPKRIEKFVKTYKERIKNRTEEEKIKFSENCKKGQARRYAKMMPIFYRLKENGISVNFNTEFKSALKGINMYEYTDEELYQLVFEKLTGNKKFD